MKKVVTVSAAVLALLASTPSYAINDPTVPGDDCAAAGAQAIGHPAFGTLIGTPAGAPGPGNSNVGTSNNNAVPQGTNC